MFIDIFSERWYNVYKIRERKLFKTRKVNVMKKIVKYISINDDEYNNATECMTDDIENSTIEEIVHICKKNGGDCSTCPFYYDSQCCVIVYMCGGSDYDKITSPDMWGGLKLDEECD